MKTQSKKQPRRRPRVYRPLQIAVCGKDPANAAHIWRLIADCGMNTEVYCFSSADALMRRYAKGRYAFIFCDTETARIIRGRDMKTLIAVTANDIKKARQALAGLNILKFIQGAAAEDDITDMIALYGVQRCNKRQIVITAGSAGILPASAGRGSIKIPADTIYRAERRGRGCFVYSTRGIIKTGRAYDFNALTETLSAYGFTLREGGVLINPRYRRFMDESEIPPAANPAQNQPASVGARIARPHPSVSTQPVSVGARFIAPTPFPPVSVSAATCRPRPLPYGNTLYITPILTPYAIPRAPPIHPRP